MKNLLTQGVSALEEALATKPRRNTNYFKLGDGQSVFVRFLQELDPESEYYSEEAGVASLVTYVSPPVSEGWKYKYVVPEELMAQVADWDFKTRLLINMLVDSDEGEKVMFWDASKQVARQLLELNNEEGAITDRLYKVKRSGSGTSTTYMFFGKSEDGGISVDKYVEEITQPDEYLRELTQEDIDRHVGETSDVDTDAGAWT